MAGVLPLDELLTELRLRRWTLYRWGRADDPELVAATFDWGSCADVLVLRRDETASGHRTLTFEGADPLRPAAVLFQYHAVALWTLRAMLALPPPGHPGAPADVQTPHRLCGVPDGLPRPLVIRPLRMR